MQEGDQCPYCSPGKLVKTYLLWADRTYLRCTNKKCKRYVIEVR